MGTEWVLVSGLFARGWDSNPRYRRERAYAGVRLASPGFVYASISTGLQGSNLGSACLALALFDTPRATDALPASGFATNAISPPALPEPHETS